jgi:hypothetical protein
MFEKEKDMMVKAMFGEHAFHAPLNYISQSMSPEYFVALAQSKMPSNPLIFGQDPRRHTHLLVMGDVIFRPHLVIRSNHLRGMGLSGIATSNAWDVAEWLEKGELLFDLGCNGWLKEGEK